VPGILISSRWTLKVPDLTIRGGLGGILVISGLKLLLTNWTYANWLFGGSLVFLAVVLAIYTANVMLSGTRATPERA
jgi:hypothetical protein